uniref:SP-RING-type domain-containing protein n=1 Tax=Globisporangium ultimum (strain ATCC 200006 / CBS 805.95 / DAOM BR144) TaxID=431595 RepID=K3W6U2_GLOUD
MDDDLETSITHAMPAAMKMALYAAKKQNFEILKYTIEGFDSLCNNASMLKDFEDQDHVSALEETTKEFAVLETQLAQYKQQLDKMEIMIESGELDPVMIDKMIDESLVEPKMNATKHEFYKRFCEKAGIELEQDGDEDVVFQQSESTRSTICPVTQLEMEKPLRNPSCNHTYSEQGIRAHLQRSKKCPVAGCPQKLSFSNLERDVEMEVLIARRKSGAQQQRTQTNSASAPRGYSDDEAEDEEYVVD